MKYLRVMGMSQICNKKILLERPTFSQMHSYVKSRGVTRYEIVVGHTLNPFSKSGGALCYQTTKKWWGTCPQAPPMVTPLLIQFSKLLRYLLAINWLISTTNLAWIRVNLTKSALLVSNWVARSCFQNFENYSFEIEGSQS